MSASFHLWTLHVQESHEVSKAESYLWAHKSSLLTHSTTELWPISSRDQTLALGMAPYFQDTRVPLDGNRSRSLRILEKSAVIAPGNHDSTLFLWKGGKFWCDVYTVVDWHRGEVPREVGSNFIKGHK